MNSDFARMLRSLTPVEDRFHHIPQSWWQTDVLDTCPFLWKNCPFPHVDICFHSIVFSIPKRLVLRYNRLCRSVFSIKWRYSMKLRQTKLLKLILFICCTVSFLISLKLFWDLGVFCDEFGTSPDEVCGGEFGLFMVWLRMGLLFLATIGSALALLHNREQ